MKVSKSFSRGAGVIALIAFCAAPALLSARIGTAATRRMDVLRQRMQALDRAEEQFDRLVEKGDDASVLEYVGIVEAARAELNKTRTVMLLRMRRSLTADQWARFTALAEQRYQRERKRTPDRRQR